MTKPIDPGISQLSDLIRNFAVWEDYHKVVNQFAYVARWYLFIELEGVNGERKLIGWQSPAMISGLDIVQEKEKDFEAKKKEEKKLAFEEMVHGVKDMLERGEDQGFKFKDSLHAKFIPAPSFLP